MEKCKNCTKELDIKELIKNGICDKCNKNKNKKKPPKTSIDRYEKAKYLFGNTSTQENKTAEDEIEKE